jgi:asparagine synthase (glutamine-hydrolysing)
LADSYAPGATLYTGDGGDRTLPPIVPVKPIRGLRGLSRHILDYEYYEELCLPHEDAAALCGLAPRDLVDALTEQLAQYPEDDMDMKFVHYSMYCEAYGYLFEGQDRNRFYFWNAAPFYSQPFFEEALACPDDQKEYYELYRRFLDRLSPLISDTAYSNLGAPLTSPKIKSRVRRFNLKARFPRAMRLAKRIIKGEDVLPADSVIPELIEKQIAACPAVGETLNVDHIRRMAGDRKRYHRQTVMNLLTMTSIIEDLSRGESSLAEYADQEL